MEQELFIGLVILYLIAGYLVCSVTGYLITGNCLEWLKLSKDRR